MRVVLYAGSLLLVTIVLSACGTGVYTKGYYSRHGLNWSRDVHIVQLGETLYSIAWQYGQDYHDVARWNGISEPYTIYPQQELRVVKPTHAETQKNRNVTNVHNSAPTPVRAARPTSAPLKIQTDKVRPVAHKLVWRWPARGRVVNGFSARDPGQKGIDIEGKNGQPIYAAESGYVVYSGSGLRGYGKLIIIKHNETFLSAYAHNEKLLVTEGQKVKKGEHIADMGKTGTNRVKLHFEIRRNGTPVNPLTYLPRP